MKKSRATERTTLEGAIAAFNTSPKGVRESVLVETDGALVQIIFPKHGAEKVLAELEVGAPMRVEARLAHTDGAHRVYLAEDAHTDTSGKVVRWNYALHGETNGFHLDDGTFVHLKPEGAAKSNVRLGDRVRVSGPRRIGAHAIVIETDPSGVTRESRRAT